MYQVRNVHGRLSQRSGNNHMKNIKVEIDNREVTVLKWGQASMLSRLWMVNNISRLTTILILLVENFHLQLT